MGAFLGAHHVGAAPVDFAREVEPIFKSRCISCHGPQKQRGGLRLDRKQDALRGGDNHRPAIKPGDTKASSLLHMVSGLEADLKMPPQGAPLTAQQIATLRRWIEEGAPWPEESQELPTKPHWSFQPVTRPPVPTLPNSKTLLSNPIDSFLLAKLKEKDLSFSPEADRRTLIRRLYFSLVGLPPAPEEIEKFISDKDPQAYAKLVDKLLASPRYGERWARHWLDVVRFAESHGFEMNRARENAWPYRDYVIRAFNADKPYDRFIIEQIAGDQLGEDAATGFLVGGSWDEVKSPDSVLTAQQRSDELHDIASTTGSAFLGLTVGCARCHAHKFDPISQTDYFRFVATFSGVAHGERPLRPTDYQERLQKIATLKTQTSQIQKQLEALQPVAQPGRRLLVDDKSSLATNIQPPVNSSVEYSPGTERGQMNDAGDINRLPNLGLHYRYWDAKPNEGHDFFRWNPQVSGHFRIWLSWGAWTTHTPDARYILDRDGDLKTTEDQSEIAIVNQSQFADGTPAIANQKRWSDFKSAGTHELQVTSCVVLRGGKSGGPTVADVLLFEAVETIDAVPALPHLRAPVTHAANVETFSPLNAKFVRLTITNTNSAEPCLDELEIFSGERNMALAKNGAKATASGTLPGYAIHQLQHINDGRYGNSHSWISNEAGKGWVQIELAQSERIQRIVWSRDRADNQEKPFEDRLATGYFIEVSSDGKEWRKVASSADRLPDEYRARISAIHALPGLSADDQQKAAQLVAQRTEAQNKIRELGQWPLIYAGQFSQPEATHRFSRGDPMQPKEVVAPGGLSAFGKALELPVDTPEAKRRIALAKWIADPQHPLTARVLVNRLWLGHFGSGLVETPSDFGLNGALPSHPELLDWLADEFVRSGWSIKHMQRLIVNSTAFKQSSQTHTRGLAVDSAAKFLWRFPPRRVEAEVLRDNILQVSGQLDLQMGGPGFDLFEPNDNYVKVYQAKKNFGKETFRRMVYQSKPRLQLDDTFGVFDCPDAGQIAPKRHQSTTPLQALALLNSPFLLQQSELFAQRIQHEVGTDKRAQVKRAFVLALGRVPSEDEANAAQTLLEQHGLSACCRALLNANEFLYVF
jgi:hypothetical protein